MGILQTNDEKQGLSTCLMNNFIMPLCEQIVSLLSASVHVNTTALVFSLHYSNLDIADSIVTPKAIIKWDHYK